jgi:hypothetical protein
MLRLKNGVLGYYQNTLLLPESPNIVSNWRLPEYLGTTEILNNYQHFLVVPGHLGCGISIPEIPVYYRNIMVSTINPFVVIINWYYRNTSELPKNFSTANTLILSKYAETTKTIGNFDQSKTSNFETGTLLVPDIQVSNPILKYGESCQRMKISKTFEFKTIEIKIFSVMLQKRIMNHKTPRIIRIFFYQQLHPIVTKNLMQSI